MKFFTVYAPNGENQGCFLTMREAKEVAWPGGEIVITKCPVTPDTIRRMLGDHGGYATDMKIINVT